MSCLDLLRQGRAEATPERLAAFAETDVARAVSVPSLTKTDFLSLLSPAAAPHLEAMARRAGELTVQHFGRTVQLFTPLYLANHCSNHCVYCGFNAKNRIERSRLSMQEVEAEAEAISATGLKHILILTGEDPKRAGVEYLEQAMAVLAPRFPSVSIEVFPMGTNEYQRLVRAGVDGLTIYQETYDEQLYAILHPAGPKRDYAYRLDAPERGCQAGMRQVNLGALLGLADWRREAYLAGLHANHLQRAYPGVDVGLSLPRMRTHVGGWEPEYPVNDRQLVQIMLALRLFLPRASLTISTREPPELRDNLLGLGVTRMSAGVSTTVGGRSRCAEKRGTGQFDISDPRSVDEMCQMLKSRGYQPVFKDWEPIFHTGQASGQGQA